MNSLHGCFNLHHSLLLREEDGSGVCVDKDSWREPGFSWFIRVYHVFMICIDLGHNFPLCAVVSIALNSHHHHHHHHHHPESSAFPISSSSNSSSNVAAFSLVDSEAEGCPAKCHDGEFSCHAPPPEEAEIHSLGSHHL